MGLAHIISTSKELSFWFIPSKFIDAIYNTIHFLKNIKNIKNITNFSKKSGFDRL